MSAKRPPIDRRIVPPENDSSVVMFPDPSGATPKSYDLKSLGLPADITAFLCTAFAGHYVTKRRHPARLLVLFENVRRFVAQDGLVWSATDLTTAMLGRYKIWLDLQKTQYGESRTRRSDTTTCPFSDS